MIMNVQCLYLRYTSFLLGTHAPLCKLCLDWMRRSSVTTIAALLRMLCARTSTDHLYHSQFGQVYAAF